MTSTVYIEISATNQDSAKHGHFNSQIICIQYQHPVKTQIQLLGNVSFKNIRDLATELTEKIKKIKLVYTVELQWLEH